MSRATQEFLSYTLTPYFIQGYGLTETTAYVPVLSLYFLLYRWSENKDERDDMEG